MEDRINDINIYDIDKVAKVNIYLLRKYGIDLMREFGIKNDDPFALAKTFDIIAVEMNKEMPELWYTYGFGGKDE